MDTTLLLADILGYIGFILLFIQIVIGSRHVFGFFTRDTVFISKLHKYLGKYGIFFIMLHPITTMFVRWESWLWILTPNFNTDTETNITLGRFAIFILLLIWVTSAVIKSKIKWRPWKYLHLLSYPLVFLVLLHIPDIGTLYEKYFIFKFIWLFAFIIFGLSILYRLSMWSGIFKAKYKIIEKRLISADIIFIKLSPIANILNSNIAQHFFLQSDKFKSEHPFTVIRNENGDMSFAIRRVAGFFEEINNKNINDIIFVDGPYGVFTKEGQNENKKVLISAGVGATPFINLVEKYPKNNIYINCNKNINEVLERDALVRNTETYIDILNVPPENWRETDQNVSQNTSQNISQNIKIKTGIINKDIIIEATGSETLTLPYFICGSPAFINVVKNILKEIGIKKENIFIEELGF